MNTATKHHIEEEEAYRAKLREQYKSQNNTNKESTPKTKWYAKTWTIILSLLLFAPLGIFLLWKYGTQTAATKQTLTVTFGGLFLWNIYNNYFTHEPISIGFLIFPLAIFLLWRYGTKTLSIKQGLAVIGGLIVLGGLFVINYKPSSQEQQQTQQIQQPQETAAQKEAKAKQEAQQLETLSNTFCSERSQPYVRAVNFTDFIAMYEANGDSVTLHPANGVYPTNENCKKIAKICMDLWNKDDCQKIAEKKIWIGMTKEQLMLSWGLPNDRNNTVYSSGVHSQWVYGDFGPYVYLEGKSENDMTVTSYQD